MSIDRFTGRGKYFCAFNVGHIVLGTFASHIMYFDLRMYSKISCKFHVTSQIMCYSNIMAPLPGRACPIKMARTCSAWRCHDIAVTHDSRSLLLTRTKRNSIFPLKSYFNKTNTKNCSNTLFMSPYKFRSLKTFLFIEEHEMPPKPILY